MTVSLRDRLARRIRADGPMPYSDYVHSALYDPVDGFYPTGGSAGRHGDFLTSPELGPLFGTVLAGALDRWWIELGRPDPYVVAEAGAGRGALARAVLAARPACGAALGYHLVEVVETLRRDHADIIGVTSAARLPCAPFRGVIVANELIDNLPFDLLEWRNEAWWEVRVDTDPAGDLVEVLSEPARNEAVVTATELAAGSDPSDGSRIPVHAVAADWLRWARASLTQGRIVLFDYGGSTAGLAGRPWRDWVRTYRGHARGGHPLAAPGHSDVTTEVAFDQLAHAIGEPTEWRSQAEFLTAHGIDGLTDEGRRIWDERAHLGDLTALRMRSRIREAEALRDPAGLGAFRVAEWTVPYPPMRQSR